MGISNLLPTSQQNYLFNRKYAITLAQAGQSSGLTYGTDTPIPSPIRITFDIDRMMSGTAGKAKIELYNLTDKSRQSIKKGYFVQLQAGYKAISDTIFSGNVVLVKTARSGPDIITSLECGDGESSIVFATMNKTYGSNTTLLAILTDVIRAMAAVTNVSPVAVDEGIIIDVPTVVYNNGFLASGSCRDILDKLLKPVGMQWTIQNGALNIIPQDKHNGSSAVVVSSETGMIGVPSNVQNGVQFTSLLNPNLIPGALVHLISFSNTEISGFYKINKSKYEGDSHDNKWQVSCECTSIEDQLG